MANHLAAETSPYLLQHAGNPVEWYPWGEAALRLARESDKPILLSIGYSACHWCHVMAHESFENAETATLMNELFVNIKVDREERPDLDAIYMQAVQALSGHGGWPMTVFLVPDGTPFYGGTYFPPERRHGMPAFREVLQAVADTYHERRADATAVGEQLTAVMAPGPLSDRHELTEEVLVVATQRLLQQLDSDRGGFGSGPKFPQVPVHAFLLQQYVRSGAAEVRSAIELSLDAMANRGLFDHVGGGFHRYTVDPQWTVPHFEKMLYDNAQLATLYLHAFQVTGTARWREIVERTLDYVAREMLLPGGGFASSQDADSADGEGTYFVWTPDQLRAALGDDAAFAAAVFGVTDEGNFEGATVLAYPSDVSEFARKHELAVDEFEQRLEAARTKMLTQRAARLAPGRDDKVVLSWNAMMLSAFAEAGRVLQRDDYLAIATTCAEFLWREMVVEGRVRRSWKDGAAKTDGFLEDVAHLTCAFLTLFQVSGDARHFERAIQLATAARDDYFDPTLGYCDTASHSEQLVVRPRTLDDSPLPSGNSALAVAFLQLYGLTGDEAWYQRALEIIEPLVPAIERSPQAVGTLACAADVAVGPLREIAVVGAADDPRTRELLAVLWAEYAPRRVVAVGAADSDIGILRDRSEVEGNPAAYVCEAFVCALPVTTADALRAALSD